MTEAQFGVGVGSYLMSDFDRAESEFQAVIQAGNQNLIGKAFYNLGNTLYQQGLFEESAGAYKKSLEIVPEDYDAKYNYELSKRMLQQQMNQNSQKRPSSENEKNEESNEEQPSSQSDDKDQPQQQDSEDQNNTQMSNEQKTEETQSESERKEEDQPKPDAETILNALKANEKNLMKRQLDRGMKSKKLEKDW
ncbi:MAG: tetratricopeptide repeat protein [Candidatus Marinimicrobia bacterium]|nr:tetratricopeptide repeat protein [Candidatus Neomarinimicrobiota bacterium]